MIITETVIVAGKRTPFAKYGGAWLKHQAVELGGAAIKAVLNETQLSGEQIDEVMMGMVLQAGAGQLPSRQAARQAGLPWRVRSETVNKVCASGMLSIAWADRAIRMKEANWVIAGGMESMSHAPYLLPHMRFGQRMGHGQVIDSMLHDGLWCAYCDVHMIEHANEMARQSGISREEQDEWALQSHTRAWQATQQGMLQEEMIADQSIELRDETIRPHTNEAKLAQLQPVLHAAGTITAGNAPGVNDGAAALLLASDKAMNDWPLSPLGTIVAHASVAEAPQRFPLTPIGAIRRLLQRTGYQLKEIDLFEINEAFALVPLLTMQALEIERTKVNVNGGAVAIGHPIGASGCRIVLTLAHALRRRGGGLGIAAICSGGGQGDAILIRVDG